MFQLNENSKIIFVRGAFLGDFLVCLPLIYKILTDYNVENVNVNFLIFNNLGTNPIKIIFGKNHPFTKNTQIINTKNILTVIKSLGNIKNDMEGTLFYLPMWKDSLKGQLLKYIMLKYIFGITKKIHGIFKLSKKYQAINSQYLTPFNSLGLAYDANLKAIDIFELIDKEKLKDNVLKIAIYPNSKLKMKIWGKDKYIALIHELVAQYQPNVYLIGGKEDEEYNNSITNQLKDFDSVINLAGTLDVKDTLAFLKEMDLFIGNDGFPMHLAAIANIPIVGLFTYKNPIGCWDPIIANKMITIRANVSCKECYLAHCENPVCLTEINVDAVFESAKELINNHSIYHKCMKTVLTDRLIDNIENIR